MRLCILSSHYPELLDLEQNALLKKVFPSLAPEPIEHIYIATYRLGEETGRLRPLGNSGSWRMTFCRRLFRALDELEWLPAFLAAVPLKLCQEEMIETLVGGDPDMIVLWGIRWGKQLQSVLSKHFPHWAFVREQNGSLRISTQRRSYDPSVKVSIVLPTYNGTKYIRRSIDSCLRQTHQNVELLIVDDGSKQDMRQIVNEYNDARVRYFRHPTNLGVAAGLNTGFHNSTGEYLTWTSDDNYYADNAIEEMVRFLQTYSGTDFVYADSFIIDEKNPETGLRVQLNKAPDSLAVDNFIGACFLYTRKVYETLGGYDPKTFLAEDYDYWVRVSQQFCMRRLFKPLYYYRFHADSLTARHDRSEVVDKVKLVKRLNKITSG